MAELKSIHEFPAAVIGIHSIPKKIKCAIASPENQMIEKEVALKDGQLREYSRNDRSHWFRIFVFVGL
ncbi:hypothetical protein L596_022518 [Steinernema carpocapsae]|uniref:Uncharacterized protein n=1 Tax=Steinernema carpocapsae TaxID=34508 RepID=A0A4V6A093_STECR|nr:hypothetical protein L596_022518 [Steinernema carpocapsae]